ncbi:MadS family sensor histidine kinase [Nocardioides iriomotensis]|uniref:histidine kinase n=1 Tax=Nocardioides iriomotensis TaxID=715784 RepID=A0A4Q5J476_9ACTN|nr:histidine kinase [Nocardioides iriomotensis]RYU13460.1 sensor histidine kinase [Nocardioides iriomotensis]
MTSDPVGDERPGPKRPDLVTLTGVRSGKRSYYRAYVRSDERLQRAVRAMDSISRALVRTVEGPRGLLEEVARAAAQHLEAEWTILALGDGHLTGARPRFLVVDATGEVFGSDGELPGQVRRELGAIRAGHAVRAFDDSRWVRVPMSLEGRQVGSLAGLHGLEVQPEPSDLSVLRILANQAAVSLHTSEQYQAGLTLHRRAQRLYDEATAQAQHLAERTRELRQAEQRLVLAHQRELLDAERHRIARELHDSVTQYVLSAGMAVEVARGDVDAYATGARDGSPEGARRVLEQLETAKKLSQEAVDQLRRAIYALHQTPRETVSTLPELLQEVTEHHRPQLDVGLHVEGDVVMLGNDADHEIARAVGEAMFNVATHARATRAAVRLRYRTDEILVSVADNGQGTPAELSRMLRVERRGSPDGRHRGLANIETRIVELGGTVAFRRARLGGVRVEMRVPLPLPANPRRGIINELVGTGRPASTDVDQEA